MRPSDRCCQNVPTCYVADLPCRADPTQVTDPNAVTPFNTSQIDNRGNYPHGANLPVLYDNHLGTAWVADCNSVTPGDPCNFDLDFYFDRPLDFVTAMRIYHGWGSIHNDWDGVGPGGLVQLLDVNMNVMASQPMVSGNNGSGWVTPFPGGPYMQVRGLRMITPHRTNPGNNGLGIREVQLLQEYRSVLTWVCGANVFTAVVAGDAPALTVAGGVITNTGGPKQLTFRANGDGRFTGTLVTDNPALFDTLTVTQANPVINVLASGTAQFRMEWDFESPARVAVVDMDQEPPVWTDAATGAVLAPGTFTPRACI